MPDARFNPDGDRHVPSELTRWLLAAAVEGEPTVMPMRSLASSSIPSGPVPTEPLRAETHVLRECKRIQVVEAIPRHGDVAAGRESEIRIRTSDVQLPDVTR